MKGKCFFAVIAFAVLIMAGNAFAECVDGDSDWYFRSTIYGCSSGFYTECVDAPACDCDDTNPDVNPGRPIENTAALCGNGYDDDCSYGADCVDPNCGTQPHCQPQCVPSGEESASYPLNCNDGVDNDCDGLIDCSDTGCFGTGYCAPAWCVADSDNNGHPDGDNDGDGYYNSTDCGTSAIDCNDANANINPGNIENTLALCTDGIDNDCDGKGIFTLPLAPENWAISVCADDDCKLLPECKAYGY